MRVYLLVMLIAAAVTFVTTPFARWTALRVGAITAVRERDVHSIPTPRLGGLAMLLGLAAAITFASQMPFLHGVFVDSQAWAVLMGSALVCALGMADDIWDLDWMVKLAGQFIAAAVVVVQGVQLTHLPISGGAMPGQRTTILVSIIVVVVAMNAVNFVDGLDGLLAGMIGIGGLAFFVYTYFLTQQANPEDYSNLASLIVAALVGVCFGFLPHNFHPARIFMGDSGSMVLGLVISAGSIVVTGNIDLARFGNGQQFPAYLPILLPLAVVLLPLADMVMAVVRRLAKGKSPFHPDRLHLHHRMLAIGHSHRRAVVILYLWTAIFAFGSVALVWFSARRVAIGLGIAVLVGIVLTLGPLRFRGRFLDDAKEEDPGVVEAYDVPTASLPLPVVQQSTHPQAPRPFPEGQGR